MVSDLEAIVKAVEDSKTICLVGHQFPDGDSLGSILSLTLALKQLNKQVFPLCFDDIPDKYSFLPGISLFCKDFILEEKLDLLIFLDCSEPGRIGENVSKLMERASLIVNIDHHPDNRLFGHLNFHDEKSAATGELVFRILQQLKVNIDISIATNLYTSIATDTGSFAYTNTTPFTHEMASFLLKKGVNPAQVSEYAFQMKSYPELKLIGKALNNLQISKDGSYAWISLPLEWFAQTGCSLEATEGVVNYARYIPGVQVGIVFKEIEKQIIKISFRSSPNFDVSKIAARFGGGGHRQAAGCIIKGDLAFAQEKVFSILDSVIAEGM